MADSLLARKYFDGIYIPSGLLVVGTLIVKKEWAPYAVLVAILLGSIKFYNSRMAQSRPLPTIISTNHHPVQSPKRSSGPTPSKILSSRKRPSSPTMSPCTSPLSSPSPLPLLTSPPSSYRFALPKATSILGLPIGQHISIGAVLPQPDGTSKEIVRSYTPISGDHQPGYFDLLIKSYPTGNISRHMASLAVGQSIRVKGPKGAFVYTPNMVRHFGMIAGGTGITPMLQVVRAIVRGRAAGDATQVDLIFANVTPQDILLKEDLDALVAEDKGIRVHYVLDRPPAGWTGGVGYVTAEMITVCSSLRPCRVVCVC